MTVEEFVHVFYESNHEKEESSKYDAGDDDLVDSIQKFRLT